MSDDPPPEPAETMKSEFGRGYITCLLQFTFHEGQLDHFLRTYSKVRTKRPGDPYNTEFTDARAIDMWCYAAYDHLYDLIRPRKMVSREEWRRAQAIQARVHSRRMGNFSFGGPPASPITEEGAHGIIANAKKIVASAEGMVGFKIETVDDAMRADRMFGLHPVRGEWSCDGPADEMMKKWEERDEG